MNKKQRNKELLLEKIKTSPIIQIVCEKSGISRATYYRWRKEDKRFAKEADTALEEGILLVNDMAESQLLAAIRNQNMTAIIFWLKNHHIKYTDKLEVMDKTKATKYKLTAEQEEIVKKALKLGGLINQEVNHDKKTK